MSKTAMQELIEKCQDEFLTFEELGKWVSASAYMLLEKEKQQIIDAGSIGYRKGLSCHMRWTSEDYYNETFANQ